jgi:hypothetical protein
MHSQSPISKMFAMHMVFNLIYAMQTSFCACKQVAIEFLIPK